MIRPVSPAVTNTEMSVWLGRLYPRTNEIVSRYLGCQMYRDHWVTVALFLHTPICRRCNNTDSMQKKYTRSKHWNCSRLPDILCRATLCMKAVRVMMPLDSVRSGNDASWLCQANSRLHQKTQRIVCYIILFPILGQIAVMFCDHHAWRPLQTGACERLKIWNIPGLMQYYLPVRSFFDTYLFRVWCSVIIKSKPLVVFILYGMHIVWNERCLFRLYIHFKFGNKTVGHFKI